MDKKTFRSILSLYRKGIPLSQAITDIIILSVDAHMATAWIIDLLRQPEVQSDLKLLSLPTKEKA